MKKIYINPTTDIVAMKLHQMIAVSLNPDAGTGTVSEGYAPEDGDGEAKGFTYNNVNIWEE